jgi:hypothetical protein
VLESSNFHFRAVSLQSSAAMASPKTEAAGGASSPD